MRKNWIGTGVLVGASLIAGALFSQIWEQVLGQPGSFSVEVPQVVVNQPAELPKWCVDFVTLPAYPGVRVITIVDTESKAIVVYHEDLTTGGVTWLSTRNIQQDLMFRGFNVLSPTPMELIRELERSKGKN